MVSEFQPNSAKTEEVSPLTEEEVKQLTEYLESYPSLARDILKQIIPSRAAPEAEMSVHTEAKVRDTEVGSESVQIPAELEGLEKFGDFLKAKIEEKKEGAIALVKEMKTFVNLASTLKIDGTRSFDEQGNPAESLTNAGKLAKEISVLSEKFYELLYSELEEMKSKYKVDTLDANYNLKTSCEEYIKKSGIKGIEIYFAFEGDRFDMDSMLATDTGFGGRTSVTKPYSWIVKYAGVILKHARVDAR